MYGRRVHGAETAVDVEGRGGQRQLEALRQHHLDDVAGADVLLRALDEPLEGGRRHVGPQLAAPVPARRLGAHHRCLQARDEGVDPRDCRIVRPVRRGPVAEIRVRHDADRLADVVEHQDALHEHHADVGQREVVLRGDRQTLERPHGVVAEIADGAADEAGQTRKRHRAARTEQALQLDQGVVGGASLHRPVRGFHLDLVTADPQHTDGLGAEEAEPTPALPALHALEEEAVWAAMDLQERRDRRLQVGEDLPADRNEVTLLGEGVEILPGRPGVAHTRPARGRPAAGRHRHSAATVDRATPSRGRCVCVAGSSVLLDAVAVGALRGCPPGAAPAVGDRFA